MDTVDFGCSNVYLDAKGYRDCKKVGRFGCKGCLLVSYCGAECQKQDWTRHKLECRSPLSRSDWQPAWVADNRTPAFIRGGIGQVFGRKKYLWGNVPAVDLLNLPSNEGVNFQGEVSLLFAASGDIRNVVMTIARIPDRYDGIIKATVNDRDIDIVSRNVILLLAALVIENSDEAADCMLHVWYSAFLRKSHISLLHDYVRPLIDEVYQKIMHKDGESLLGKTWSFGRRKLRLVLKKSAWEQLLSSLGTSMSMTADKARAVRADVVMAESRRDYRERALFCQPPQHRVAINKFRDDGILLPFGASRREFSQPNPTFFASECWPMTDNADPRNGWSPEEVAATSSGVASNDAYGKLFYFIRQEFRRFLKRISALEICFELLQVDAQVLPDHLGNRQFSRIEVSNIADQGWLGIHRTLLMAVPLLQTSHYNPHATLLTLFMNAVDETLTDEDKIRDATHNSSATKRLLEYLPPDGRRLSKFDPRIVKFNLGRDLVTDYRPIFTRFSTKLHLSEAAHLLGASRKSTHTIIEQWPYRLKLRPGDPGAQKEFDRCLAGGITGKECYVEWQRTHQGVM